MKDDDVLFEPMSAVRFADPLSAVRGESGVKIVGETKGPDGKDTPSTLLIWQTGAWVQVSGPEMDAIIARLTTKEDVSFTWGEDGFAIEGMEGSIGPGRPLIAPPDPAGEEEKQVAPVEQIEADIAAHGADPADPLAEKEEAAA